MKLIVLDEYERYMEEYRDMIGKCFQLPKRQFNKDLSNIYREDRDGLIDIEPIVKGKYKASLVIFIMIQEIYI